MKLLLSQQERVVWMSRVHFHLLLPPGGQYFILRGGLFHYCLYFLPFAEHPSSSSSNGRLTAAGAPEAFPYVVLVRILRVCPADGYQKELFYA